MSFYKDLGVRHGASLEEIREQYRVLVRLLHPDRFVDPVLKSAAESQLRRFNEIEAVLTDPDRRREYDGLPTLPVKPNRKPLPWNSLAWGVAALTCALAIVWVTNRESLPVPSPHNDKSAIASKAPAPFVSGEEWRTRARAAIAERDQALRELAQLKNGFVSQISNWVASPLTGRFSGAWFYANRSASSRKVYTPEYIETQITERDGKVRGRYRSRYRVANLPVLSSVNFEFSGDTTSAAGAAARIPLVRDDGALGEVRLRLLSERELELAWSVASPESPGITSGTAVLVRSQ